MSSKKKSRSQLSNNSSGISSPNLKKVKKNPPISNDSFQDATPYIKCVQVQKNIKKLCEYRERLITFVETTQQNDKITLKTEDTLIKNELNKESPIPSSKQTIEEVFSFFESIEANSLEKKFKPRNWSDADLSLMFWVVKRFCQFNNVLSDSLKHEDWAYISSLIPFKTEDQCKSKFYTINQSNLKTNPWLPEEEQCLMDILKNKDMSKIKWSDVAKELEMCSKSASYKTPKLCRERWNNYLNPELKKGDWKTSEDFIILKKILLIGKKWSEIAKNLTGRNENSVKNRFFSIMKKEKRLTHNYSISSKSEEKYSLDSSSQEIVPKEDELIRKILKKMESQEMVLEKGESSKMSLERNENSKGFIEEKSSKMQRFCSLENISHINHQFTLNEIRPGDNLGFYGSNLFHRAEEIASSQELPQFRPFQEQFFPTFNHMEYPITTPLLQTSSNMKGIFDNNHNNNNQFYTGNNQIYNNNPIGNNPIYRGNNPNNNNNNNNNNPIYNHNPINPIYNNPHQFYNPIQPCVKNIPHPHSLTNLDSGSFIKPFFGDSLKCLDEEFNNNNNNKNILPTFGMQMMSMSDPMMQMNLNLQDHSETLIKHSEPLIPHNTVQSSESLKEINIMKKLHTIQEDEKSSTENISNTNNPHININNETVLKLKVVPVKNIKLKTKNNNLFHAIVDLHKNEIVIMKQITPNLSPKSSGSRHSYLSALLSLNQSFGSLQIPSNDSIKSNEKEANIQKGFQRCQKEGNSTPNNSHFKDFK